MQDISRTDAASASGKAADPTLKIAALLTIKFGAVAGMALMAANCSQAPQGSRLSRQEAREIGSFSGRQWGTASPRVVSEGEAVPKGGGREHIGRSYSVAGRRYTPYAKPTGYAMTGAASWYGAAFHGRKTANGEVYDRHGISAAHPTMPLPSYARVTNMGNGRSIVVRVNDRGPFHAGRIIDLSQRTAEMLEFRHIGTARVRVEYLGRASLAGSDDRRLMASLTTDGSPASIPGMSVPATMVASAPPLATPRVQVRQAVEEVAEAPAPVAAPVSAPVLQASTIPAPVATSEANRLVRGAPTPPSRPFDLATIPGAAVPIAFAGPVGGGQPVQVRGLTASGPAQRPVVASLFFAESKGPAQRFSSSHPLVRDLTPQKFVSLAQR